MVKKIAAALIFSTLAVPAVASEAVTERKTAPGPSARIIEMLYKQNEALTNGYNDLAGRLKKVEDQQQISRNTRLPDEALALIEREIDRETRLLREDFINLKLAMSAPALGESEVDALRETVRSLAAQVTEGEASSDIVQQIAPDLVAMRAEIAELRVQIDAQKEDGGGLSDDERAYLSELREANELLIKRVQEQNGQVAELLARVGANVYPPVGLTPGVAPGTADGPAIDHRAFAQSARRAAAADEVPSVDCASLDRNRDGEWSLAILNAFSTHTFLKLDAERGMVYSLDPHGKAHTHDMGKIRSMAGC